MEIKEATATVFYAAFKALPRGQKRKLLDEMLMDEEFRSQLVDIALIHESKRNIGKLMPARDYFRQRRKKNA